MYFIPPQPELSFNELVESTRANQNKYIDPIPTVMGLVFKGDQILIVKKEATQTYWHFVTGFLGVGESAEEGIIREVKEETGLVVKAREFIGTFPYQFKVIQLIVAYKLDWVSGEPMPQDDIQVAQWVDVKKEMPFKKGTLSEYLYQNRI